MYRLLVIEDDVNMRELLAKTLVREGYDCATAGSGGEGLERALKDKPDLILLDIHLPDMNGHEVCRKLKADPRVAAIPVVMLTGEARSIEERVNGLDAGAEDYLLKPFSLKELAARVKALVTAGSKPTRP
ncbi:MAG: response regulator [Elusimicrobiota bacterium]|jgi:DNA-binding response OmpR family regulator